VKRFIVIGLAGALAACGGTKLRGKASTVAELIATARDNGAERCAPVELAMAESHHDFARTELDEGDFYRAKTELAIAEKNAHAAIKKSPKVRCAPKIVVAPKPKPKPKKKLVVKVEDTDGDGIFDDKDQCVNDPEDKDGFRDEDGCPDPDNDNDGIADKVDKCPNEPEDKDGFEDDDGCPDTDNDKDGLADKVDQCPDKAEDKDGFKDDDGCPDCDNDGDGVPECPKVVDKCPNKPAKTPDGCPQKYKLVVVTKTKIELKQTIYFAFRKWVIKRRSYPLLNEVAQALKDNPHIRVRIEGHTDSIGPYRFNKRLSQRRAEAVKRYLMRKGVPSGRMIPKGYGEAVPIADNRTKAGRDQNRRVEFVIISR
jgi:outer membrane protein OmpA-like peptidoglycan-associated protein